MRPTADRYTTDIWSRCVDEISTDTRPMVYRSVNRLAVDSRPIVDHLSIDSGSTVDRQSIDIRATVDRLLTAISIECRPIQRSISRSTLPTVNMIQNIFSFFNDFNSFDFSAVKRAKIFPVLGQATLAFECLILFYHTTSDLK